MVFQTPWLGTQVLTVLLTTLILDTPVPCPGPREIKFKYGFNFSEKGRLRLQDITFQHSRSPSAVRNTMEAQGMRLALRLLTFSLLMQMISSDLHFKGLRKQLCESGHLGGKQK